MFNVTIVAWLDEFRKVDLPYVYEVEAGAEHTAAHRALMRFNQEVWEARHNCFVKLNVEIKRCSN